MEKSRETSQPHWLVSAGKTTIKRVSGIVSAGAGAKTMEALQWIVSIGSNISEATQLSDDLSRLRATLPKVSFIINRGEWGRFKSKDLAKLLLHLKDMAYDAEDLLRELDDEVLRQKMEDADRSRAGQLLSSSANLAKSLIFGSKRRLMGTQEKLDKAVEDVEGMINHMGIHVEPVQLMPETSSAVSAAEVFGRDEERDALIEMLGVTIERAEEIDHVIRQMGVPLTRDCTSRRAGFKGKGAVAAGNSVASTSGAKRRKGGSSSRANLTGDISVLPIYGIGGVGKTTLAQYIYNDERVRGHFTVRIWICVSDLFDKKRITKEIIESIPGEEFNPSCSLDALHAELMNRLKEQKLLLVLDDVWPNANSRWDEFCGPLKRGLEAGSMILVTTRCSGVAEKVATRNCEPVELEGLPVDVYWDFFSKCAFGEESPESHPRLQDIGRSISSRLCGSPLAAKTLGRLLNMELTEEHWRRVQNSELWQLPHEENDILPALQLSYLYLPQELKRCFAFCSMFPKDYSFERHEIVNIWVAQGFVETEGSMRPEDEAIGYLDDLRRRFLFQDDPKFVNEARYVMHDLIHDMAQSVSVDECLLLQDLSSYLPQQIQMRTPRTVRHMSIEVDGQSLGRMRDMQCLNKLHSLRFGTRLTVDRLTVEMTWFSLLSNILFLSLKDCELVKLPESICELNSLRYLDISRSMVQDLPEKLWSLYSLQVLDARDSSLKKIHQDVTKLVNLRQLTLPTQGSRALSRVSRLGNLSCLRNLSCYEIGKENGRRISELKGMNHLSGELSIEYICHVGNKEEAAEAGLVDKQYLKVLELIWRGNILNRTSPRDNEVVEGLCPPSRIERLEIRAFCGDRFPSRFKPVNLPTLRNLKLSNCRHLRSLSIPYLASLECLELLYLGIKCLTIPAEGVQSGARGVDQTQHASSSISRSNGIASSFAFVRLTDLCIYSCTELESLDQFLTPENMPSIKSIILIHCLKLVSLPVHSFVGFACLQDLEMIAIRRLVCPRKMVLPPSLQRLSILDCGELDMSFPACLETVTCLTLLHLSHCHNVESIPLQLIGATNKLKYLDIHKCSELSSIGGSHNLSSIPHVEISDCPKLTEVQQPFKKKQLMLYA